MDQDLDVIDRERLHSLNGGLPWCKERLVDLVLMDGTDTLQKWIQEVRGGIANQKAAVFADALLADFVRHGVLDGFREVEAPMRAAYEPFLGAHQKREDAKLATEKATHAWEMPAEDFRSKIKVLGEWAESVTLADLRRFWGGKPTPFADMGVSCTSSWLKTPGDFVKYRDYFFRAINFIREKSGCWITEGRLEQPVGISDFESSLKAFEAAQARVEACQNEEADAEAALESARLKYSEERHKAIAVLRPLSEAGQWALFRIVTSNMELPEAH